jgi:hypothetical protein
MDDDNALLASAQGIAHCLRLLADEAAILNLPHSVFAIMDALETVAMESGAGAFEPMLENAETATAIVLH